MTCLDHRYHQNRPVSSKRDLGRKHERERCLTPGAPQGFVSEFPVVTIEDPFDQDDWDAYTKLTEMMSSTQIVGDDLLGAALSRLLASGGRGAQEMCRGEER